MTTRESAGARLNPSARHGPGLPVPPMADLPSPRSGAPGLDASAPDPFLLDLSDDRLMAILGGQAPFAAPGGPSARHGGSAAAPLLTDAPSGDVGAPSLGAWGLGGPRAPDLQGDALRPFPPHPSDGPLGLGGAHAAPASSDSSPPDIGLDLTWLDTSFVEGLLRAALAAPLTEAADPASPAPAPSSPFPNATALTALLQTSQPEQDALMRALGGLASVRDAAAAPSLAPPVKLPLAPPPMAFTGQPDSVPPPSADGRGLLTEPPPVAPPGTDAVGAALHPEARSFSGAEVAAIRADFPILNQTVNGYPLAWLDNAATTQKPNAVIQAVGEFYRRDNSNVHRGAHTLAARATDAYENARRKVQTLLKAKSADEIVFVRGATEAINLVAQTFGRAVLRPGDEVLVTVLEHHANIVPWQMICRETGAILRPIPITDIGEVDIDAYLAMLGPKTRMVGLAHVSNTLGTVLPVREMTAMAHAVGARVLIDGAQGVSHMPVDVCQLGCDFYVFSGHKLFGPTGVGALYGRYELLDAMPPWQGGGNMIERVRFEDTTYMPAPTKFEAGTGILAGAVGLGAAIDYVQALGLDRIAAYEHALVDHAMSRLAQIPKLTLYGKAPNKVSVTAFLIEGLAPEKIGRFLDSRGIAVRVGHHCAQPTMDRFGVSGMVRPSFAFYNTFDEIDRLIDALYELCGAGAL